MRVTWRHLRAPALDASRLAGRRSRLPWRPSREAGKEQVGQEGKEWPRADGVSSRVHEGAARSLPDGFKRLQCLLAVLRAASIFLAIIAEITTGRMVSA